jgi:hypothetical protein
VDFHILDGGHYGFIQAPPELRALLAAGFTS